MLKHTQLACIQLKQHFLCKSNARYAVNDEFVVIALQLKWQQHSSSYNV